MTSYHHYRATEKRLYTYRTEQARREVLAIERKTILENMLPSVGVVSYSERVGKNSESLTEPERFAEQSLKDSKRLWKINREIDTLDARCHIVEYAVAVLLRIERDIIKARYFDGMNMERVGECLCYSPRQCWRLKEEAVRKIGKVLFGE